MAEQKLDFVEGHRLDSFLPNVDRYLGYMVKIQGEDGTRGWEKGTQGPPERESGSWEGASWKEFFFPWPAAGWKGEGW